MVYRGIWVAIIDVLTPDDNTTSYGATAGFGIRF